MLRIVSGSCKGKSLKSLAGDHTRPSSGRLKEALFSMLQGQLAGARFLDVFAGSGQMGLEALSRGVAEAVFIEKYGPAYRILQDNIRSCQMEEKASLYHRDSYRQVQELREAGQRFHFIYLDPPWEQAARLLPALDPCWVDLLEPNGVVIVEWDKHTQDPAELLTGNLVKVKAYGRARLSFFTYCAQADR